MKLLTKKLQDIVKETLSNYPESRDCDRTLTALIWYHEAKQKEPWNLDNFLRNYIDGKLTLADSITRARRKLQEENETLRGNKWYARKLRAEDVRQEIIESKYL